MHIRPEGCVRSSSSSRIPSLALAVLGSVFVGCGAPSDGASKQTGSVNLTSLPAAEAWVDGKAAGSTPLVVSLPEGKHEIVLTQAGFAEHRETLDVRAGATGTVDATLDAIDPTNPDTVRQVAAAYGVTVDPYQAPELHRGGEVDRGVALLFPRNDIRKEGLATFRADVTPAYDGTGWLEFRKGKTVLSREKFAPEKLVTTGAVPAAVSKAVKVGDTITWGVFYEDSRKPVTAQFEIVAKPAAAKKLMEISADKRLARQPAILRLQLEAEALQNYRLYSEALMKLLESREADKDSTMPYTGIVTCLRRLDLEDTALYSESASRALGQISKLRGGAVAAPVAARPVANAPASSPTAPAASTGGFGSKNGGLPPRGSAESPSTASPASEAAPTTSDPSSAQPMTPTPDRTAMRNDADHLARDAANQKASADQASADAAAAKARADDAQKAAEAARAAVPASGGPDADVAQRAALEAEQAAVAAAEAARVAAANAADLAARAQRAADAAANAEKLANAAGAPASTMPSAPSATAPMPTPTPAAGTSAPTPSTGANPTPHPTDGTPTAHPVETRATLIANATAAATAARDAATAATAAFDAAEADAKANPTDPAKRQAADAAHDASIKASERAAEAQAALDRLTGPK